MGHSFRLSVIVPTHGRVDLFRKTLESIQAQSIDDFELVVTDDSGVEADRDEIAAAVDRYRDGTGRVAEYIFSKPKLGQAANTNQGLHAAKGSILRILHSDDLIRPGCFEWEVSQFDRFSELTLLFQDCVPFHEVEEIRWNERPTLRMVEPTDYFRQFLSISTALPSGMLFSRESFEAVGGMREDWSFLCDWELFAKLLLRCVRERRFAGYATAGNFAWRLHDDSTTTTKWQQHYSEHVALMEQWERSVGTEDVDLFVSEDNRKAFFGRGKAYRDKRLIADVSELSASEFKAAFPWFRSELDSRLRGKVKRRAGRRILKRKVKSTLGLSAKKKSPTAASPSESDETSAADDWSPEFVITPLHGDQEIGSCDTAFVVPYDNSINLWPLRDRIAAAKRIRIAHPGLNRFYRLVLVECLKFVQPGTEIEFAFHDNKQLTWFGLKSLINQLAAERFELLYQNHNPREATAKGQSMWKIRYRCTSEDEAWHLDPINGLTIGVLTLGDRMEELGQLIETAREHCDFPYEIVLIAPKEIEAYRDDADVRQIRFSERDDLGWITRKKNLICEGARYSDIVVCHDRFTFTPSFFEAFRTWGCSYGIAAVRLHLPDGKRALDWGVVQGENLAWCKGGLLEYRDNSRYSYVPGGVTMIRKSFWERFPWCEQLYWNEHEDVELCRRIQRTGQPIRFFPGLMIALRDRWVDENPLIGFDDQRDL